MPAQQQHWIRTAFLSGATGPVAAGKALVSNGERYVVATSANRALYGRAEGVAITAGDDDDTAIELQSAGTVPNSITGLGTGSATWVIVTSTGGLERDSSPDSGEDVIGKCNARGDLVVSPWVWDDTNYVGGGFTAPTGTGFMTVTSGAMDAASLAFPLAADKGGTGLSALGANVATFLGTPSSANLAAALSDETGTGAAVFANTPTLVTPVIGAATGTSLAATTFVSAGSNVSTFGAFRCGNNTGLFARNAANNTDVGLVAINGSDFVQVGTVGYSLQLLAGASQSIAYRADTHSFTAGNGSTAISSWTTSTFTNYVTAAVADGNARCKVYSNIANVQTTDATVTTLYSWTITDECVSAVFAEVGVDKSDGTATADYGRRARIKRDGGTVTVGSVSDVWTDEDSFNGDLTIDNSTSTGRVRVTGVAATTADWGGVIARRETTHA